MLVRNKAASLRHFIAPTIIIMKYPLNYLLIFTSMICDFKTTPHKKLREPK